MNGYEPLQNEQYYHIYNRGIDSCNIFRIAGNYVYFLGLYKKHIEAIATTYARVLMPTHFHFLVKIKLPPPVLSGLGTNPTGLTAPPHQYFSNLFNACSKAYNRRYHRHGGLFERLFRSKRVTTERYFKQLITYIHNNPVLHNYCKSAYESRWSSINTYNQPNSPRIPRKEILGWFDNLSNFEFLHKHKSSICSIEDWD